MLSILMSKVMTVPLLLLFFGVSIFVHELGHFLVARWLGLVVDTFSIGFGPALWKKKHKGVVYQIACIPIGGYVALPQLDPEGMQTVQGEQKDGAPRRDLPRVAAWKRILVSVAGATGNMLLAFGLAWLVYLVGMPAGPSERSAIVGYSDPGSPAYAAGLRIGDEVMSVNGLAVRNWREFVQEAAFHAEVKLEIRDLQGGVRTLNLPTGKGVLGEQSLVGVDGRSLCAVLSVEPGSSADRAGIRPGDVIIEFAGQEVFSRAHLIALVGANKNATVPAKVRREDNGRSAVVACSVTPAFDEKQNLVRIGVVFNTAAVDMDTVVHPRPMAQVREHSTAIFRFLKALVTPKQAKAATQAVGGPVAIVASYWIIVRTSLMLAIWFTGFLNVNLAILNLLPIPVLDGGHVVFCLWEVVTRKPVSSKVVNVLVNGFAALLIGMFVLLSVRDMDRFTPLGRAVRGWFGHSAPAASAAATNAVERATGVVERAQNEGMTP
jgi:regulator of sigma E protease